MATENKVLDITYEAGEDLTADRYRIVVLDATSGKVRRPNAVTDIPLGVLQNAPDTGEAAAIRPIGCGGITKVVLAATLGIGVIAAMEYVDAADAGKAQAGVATQYPVGVLLEGGDEDELGTMLLAPLTLYGLAAHQADSTASDVPGIVSDFNALLAKFIAAGLMAAS